MPLATMTVRAALARVALELQHRWGERCLPRLRKKTLGCTCPVDAAICVAFSSRGRTTHPTPRQRTPWAWSCPDLRKPTENKIGSRQL